MAGISLADIISALPSEDSWGPPTSDETTLNGVPYAPYSKGDKLGRMADWTAEGKDGRDGRGGRQQYNRNYRGVISSSHIDCHIPYIRHIYFIPRDFTDSYV
jgi:translation initiation factor 3 subunit D